jgi:hypothetical protein
MLKDIKKQHGDILALEEKTQKLTELIKLEKETGKEAAR